MLSPSRSQDPIKSREAHGHELEKHSTFRRIRCRRPRRDKLPGCHASVVATKPRRVARVRPGPGGGVARQSHAALHGFGPARAGGWPGNRAPRRTGSARPGRSVARVQLAMTARVRSGLGGGSGPGGRAPGRATRRRTVPRRSQAVAAMAAAPHRVHLAPAQIVSRELFRVQHVCAYPIKRKFNLISNTAVTVSK